MNTVKVLGMDGKEKEHIELPSVFSTPYKPRVIQKVYNHLNSHSFQIQGRYPGAGQMVSAESRNTGLGIARIARARGEGFPRAGQAAGVAGVRKGRVAHPPVSWKNIYKKINKKEKKLALCSAIAATSNRDLVKQRGHLLSNDISLPIVVSGEIESLLKSKDLEKFLEKIGLKEDLTRTHIKRNKNNRKYSSNRRSGLSALILVSDEEKIGRLNNSLPGVSIRAVKNLSVLDLAPGSRPIRLTVFSEKAIEELKNIKSICNVLMEMVQK
ncbi:MAG TPA: 50S ribosomal protein L4 [Nitrososphaeraceae archaeon]|nr:50S ribosomal protein L4 [Nitrososphaeraceae archaeon]